MIGNIALVTGNPNKLKEIQLIAGAKIKLTSRLIDLSEIQSLDLKEVIKIKVRAAYEIMKWPVIVDDVSAGLDDLEALPGTFLKFFREKLGDIILVNLSSVAGSNRVTIKRMAAYYDGDIIHYGLRERLKA